MAGSALPPASFADTFTMSDEGFRGTSSSFRTLPIGLMYYYCSDGLVARGK